MSDKENIKNFITGTTVKYKIPPRNFEAEIKAKKHQTQKLIFNITQIAIIFLSYIAFFAIFIMAWHMLAPERSRWLDEEDLIKIKDAITYALSGFLLGIRKKLTQNLGIKEN